MLSTLATSQIRQNELKDSFILQGSGLDLRGGDGDGHVAVGTRQDMAVRSHIAYKAKFFSKAMRRITYVLRPPNRRCGQNFTIPAIP